MCMATEGIAGGGEELVFGVQENRGNLEKCGKCFPVRPERWKKDFVGLFLWSLWVWGYAIADRVWGFMHWQTSPGWSRQNQAKESNKEDAFVGFFFFPFSNIQSMIAVENWRRLGIKEWEWESWKLMVLIGFQTSGVPENVELQAKCLSSAISCLFIAPQFPLQCYVHTLAAPLSIQTSLP